MAERNRIGLYDWTNHNKLWIVSLSFCRSELKGYVILLELNNIMSNLSWLSRIVLTAVLLSGGIPKLFAPSEFAALISAYGLLPDPLVFPAAIILPLGEVVTAIGLLLNCRWAMVSVTLLLCVFIAVLSYGISLGLDIDCGCFGPEDHKYGVASSLEEARLRDLVFLVPAAYISWFSYANRKKIRR